MKFELGKTKVYPAFGYRPKSIVQKVFPEAVCVRACLSAGKLVPSRYSYTVLIGKIIVVARANCPWKAWDAAVCNTILMMESNNWSKKQVLDFYKERVR